MHFQNFKSKTSSVGGGSGFGGGGPSVTTYRVDAALALCWGPIDSINDILVAKATIWEGGPLDRPLNDLPSTLTTNQGPATVFWGQFNQQESDYFTEVHADLQEEDEDFEDIGHPPRFNYLSYITFESFNLGQTPQWPARLQVEIRRIPSVDIGLDSNAVGDRDANPAAIIYDLITSPVYGAAIPQTLINLDSFTEVGQELLDEGLGLSITFATTDDARTAVQDILFMTHCYLFMNSDGKFELGIMREDLGIDLESLPLIDDSNVLPGSLQVSNRTNSSLPSQINAQWTDLDNEDTPASLVVVNLSAQQGRGASASLVNLSGITVAEQAAKMANRIKVVQTTSSRFITFEISQKSEHFWIGDHILLSPGSWANNEQVLCRVTDIEYFPLRDNKIKVTAEEDKLSLLSGSAHGTPQKGNTSTAQPLACFDNFKLYELPVELSIGTGIEMICCVGQAPNLLVTSFTLWARTEGSDFGQITTKPTFVPSGTLFDNLSCNSEPNEQSDIATFQVMLDGINDDLVSSVSQLDFENDYQLMLVGTELVSIRDINSEGDGLYTITGVRRSVKGSAVGETAGHEIGDEIYFIRRLLNQDNIITDPQIVDGRFYYVVTPNNASRSLSFDACDEREIIVGSSVSNNCGGSN